MKRDRDQSIERLLRALPRSSGRTSHDDSCPDAETLAALADRTLAEAVRRDIEMHVADCDRCQRLTAALVRTEGLVRTGAEEAARVPSWKRRAFNWLVPAAAAATAVALWVIVPGQRTSAPEETTLDRQIAVAPAAPAAEAPTGESPQRPLDALRDQSATSAEARADRAVPVEGARPSPNELSRRQVVEQPALKAEEPPSARAVAGNLPPSREASADRRDGPPVRTVQPALPGRVVERPDAGGGGQVSGQSARNDAGRRETIQEAVITAEEPGRSAPTAPASSSAGFQARVASGSFEVVSPNSQVRWRIGPGSVVQHSANGGMTWATQQAGATTDLTAGSSPSTDVCWLVGRAGLVLRTIDAGRQWERALFPETVDIFAVTASNALSAAVTSADGRRFQTTDGGRTWAPAQ
jgi:hypothetical protein